MRSRGVPAQHRRHCAATRPLCRCQRGDGRTIRARAPPGAGSSRRPEPQLDRETRASRRCHADGCPVSMESVPSQRSLIGGRFEHQRSHRSHSFGPAEPVAPARAAAAASSRDQPSISTTRRPSGCHPRVDAASSRARTAPGSCRFREAPRMYPTSPDPRGAPPGTYRPGPSVKTMRSGPPVPTGCGYSARVSQHDRPLSDTLWLCRSVHRYARPSAISRRGFFRWRGTEPRVRARSRSP